LAVWIFLIALLPPIGGAVVTLSGECPMHKMFEGELKPPTGLLLLKECSHADGRNDETLLWRRWKA
jgi:hypothetical protein